VFYGSVSKKHLEIGNAVPPLLSVVLAKQVERYLKMFMGISQQDWWDARFKNDKAIINNGQSAEIGAVLTDKIWFDEWKGSADLIKKLRSEGKTAALDLGCGLGQLSKYFYNKDFTVTAVDFSKNALSFVNAHSPNIKTLVHDITKPLPFGDDSFDLVIANLSLHYFNESDTHNTIAEIRRVLKEKGILVGAVVSTEEYETVKEKNKFDEIQSHFYLEHFGDAKKQIRFFDRADINKFFGDFDFIYLNHKFKQRMGKTKGAWEFVYRNNKV
jgi:SAM-dependent methyltransferase